MNHQGLEDVGGLHKFNNGPKGALRCCYKSNIAQIDWVVSSLYNLLDIIPVYPYYIVGICWYLGYSFKGTQLFHLNLSWYWFTGLLNSTSWCKGATSLSICCQSYYAVHANEKRTTAWSLGKDFDIWPGYLVWLKFGKNLYSNNTKIIW